MKRTFTCIVCPNGCEIDAEYEGTNVLSVTGNLCPKGKAYVTQELIDPRRTIVRLTRPVPKDRIFDVMAEIRRKTMKAPVRIGDVVIENVLGLGSDVLITKNVEKERA